MANRILLRISLLLVRLAYFLLPILKVVFKIGFYILVGFLLLIVILLIF